MSRDLDFHFRYQTVLIALHIHSRYIRILKNNIQTCFSIYRLVTLTRPAAVEGSITGTRMLWATH